MNRARLEQIKEILKDLRDLKKQGFENQYAIDENIKFFEALKSLQGYIKWLFRERPKIDGSRLLELSDFHLSNGKWESILQAELLEIEKWRFPDNLLQFRKELLKQISELPRSSGGRILLLMSLGSGPMEIERQIITVLRKGKSTQKIVFIGVDNSQASLDTAKNNLKELNIPILQVDNLKQDELEAIKKQYVMDQFIVVLLKRDIFILGQFFPKKSIDLIYHGQFKHHLRAAERRQLDALVKQLSNKVVEDDLLNNLFIFTVPLIIRTRWFHPVLLNGAMFSSLRCPTKNELKINEMSGWQTKTFPDGYIRIYRHEKT